MDRLDGKIDIVPTLVAQGQVCPHQDYVYFSYLTPVKEQAFTEHKGHVKEALKEVGKLECIKTISYYIKYKEKAFADPYKLAKRYPQELEALLVLMNYCGEIASEKEVAAVIGLKELPKADEVSLQTALQFLVDEGERYLFCSKKEIEELKQVLGKHRVYRDKKVSLILNEELQDSLISSPGKLKSIEDIVAREYGSLGNDLRMLIFTDFMQGEKESLDKIGTDESFDKINRAGIFETVRRLDKTLNVGVLLDNLIILPRLAVPQGTMVQTKALAGTSYVKVEVFGSHREAVELANELFREGKLQVLIGTKTLTTEGWKVPYINTLLLAGFAEDMVSANRIRRSVIEADQNHPEKTVNIWHLVTVKQDRKVFLERLPAGATEQAGIMQNVDYGLVRQRFDAFMAPNYETGEIESGIDRLSLGCPPFDEDKIRQINRKMLELSEKREDMSEMWKRRLKGAEFQVVKETLVPKKNSIPSLGYMMRRMIPDHGLEMTGIILLLISIFYVVGIIIMKIVKDAPGKIPTSFIVLILFCLPMAVGVLYYLWTITIKLWIQYLTPTRSIKTMGRIVADTLIECKNIAPGAYVETKKSDVSKQAVIIRLMNATLQDQEVFSNAMQELLGPITNPQYILVRKEGKKRYKHKFSLACPGVIQSVGVLERHLEKRLGFMKVVPIKRQEGQKFLMRCRSVSINNRNARWKENRLTTDLDTKYIVEEKKNLPGQRRCKPTVNRR